MSLFQFLTSMSESDPCLWLLLVYPCFELDIKQDLQCANPCQSSNKLNKLNVLHLFAISYYLRVILVGGIY